MGKMSSFILVKPLIILKREITKILHLYQQKKRKKICLLMKKRLKNENFTIFCNTCVGGNIYHDLGLRFNTPLINSAIDINSFYLFLLDPKKYLNSIFKTQLVDDGVVGTVANELDVFFPHDTSAKEVEEKWKKRIDRINYNNMFVVIVDQRNYYNGEHMSLLLLERFLSLPYKRIIVITNDKKKCDYGKNIVFLKRYESKLMFYPGKIDKRSGKRIYEKYFDFVSWLNNE